MKVPRKKTARSRPTDETAAAEIDNALLKAAYDANVVSVIAALEAGADIAATDPATGLDALHIAVGTNNLPLVRALVEDWGAVPKPDRRGRWPSVIAARCRVDDPLCDYIVELESSVTVAE